MGYKKRRVFNPESKRNVVKPVLEGSRKIRGG